MMQRGARLAAFVAALCLGSAAVAQEGFDGPVWLDVIELGRNEVDRLLLTGLDRTAEGDLEGAAEAFRQAVDAGPSRIDALVLEARSLVQLERWAEVIARTDALASVDDTSDDAVRALFFRSVAFAAVGRYAEGAALLERITRYRAELGDAELYYGNLAELHMAAGNLDRAVLFFQQALGTDASNGAARVGLAVALAKQGRFDEARAHVLRAVVDDPEASFLDEEGVFFVPDGEGDLYRAMVEMIRGDAVDAAGALARYEASYAVDAAPEGFVETLRERMSTGGAAIESYDVVGCTPTQIALSPQADRAAVICEYGGLREVTLDGSAPVAQEAPDDYGYYSYTTVDVAYAPDGQSLRVLHSDGGAVPYTRSGTTLNVGERVHYDQYTLNPIRFVPGGERVLFTGSSSGGFMTEVWDASPVQPHLSYPALQAWIYQPAISADELTLVAVDAGTLRVLASPTWTEVASVRLDTSTSRFTPWALSHDGRELVTAHGAVLVRHAASTGLPNGVVSMAEAAPLVVSNPYDGITTIEALDGGAYAVGTIGQIHLVRFDD